MKKNNSKQKKQNKNLTNPTEEKKEKYILVPNMDCELHSLTAKPMLGRYLFLLQNKMYETL